jgi:hypothetical protein
MSDLGSGQGAIHFDVVNARNAEDRVDTIVLEEPDKGFTGRKVCAARHQVSDR